MGADGEDVEVSGRGGGGAEFGPPGEGGPDFELGWGRGGGVTCIEGSGVDGDENGEEEVGVGVWVYGSECSSSSREGGDVDEKMKVVKKEK